MPTEHDFLRRIEIFHENTHFWRTRTIATTNRRWNFSVQNVRMNIFCHQWRANRIEGEDRTRNENCAEIVYVDNRNGKCVPQHKSISSEHAI